MDQTEFQREINKLKAFRNLFAVLSLLGFFCVYYIYSQLPTLNGRVHPFVILLFILIYCFFFIFLTERFSRKIRELSGMVVKRVLLESFDLEQFQPNGRIERGTADASHLFTRDYGIQKISSDYSGSELIIGLYRGHRFCFSNLRLGYKFQRKDIAFCVLDHKGTLNDRILIKENRVPWYSARTKSDNFGEQFGVWAKYQESVDQVMSPSLKRKIVQMDRKICAVAVAQSMMDICIDENCVYIALLKKKLFETESDDIKVIEATAREDVRLLTAILDIFMDNPVLFPEVCRSDAEDGSLSLGISKKLPEPYKTSYEYDWEDQVLIKIPGEGLPKIMYRQELLWRDFKPEDELFERAIYLGQGCWERLKSIGEKEAQQILNEWGYADEKEMK